MTSQPTPDQHLRVLVAHNRYQQRGGEDAVVESEVALLRQHGHAVLEYQRDNHDLEGMSRVRAVAQTLWSTRTVRDVESAVSDFKPDVLHVHNTFPLISPSIYWAAARHRLPVVQTLHNFRLICPQAMLLRDGKPCEACVGQTPWQGVLHRCYRGSATQTGALATMLTGHRAIGTYSTRITRYIALNSFCRDRFIAGGLPADRIVVKPNFVDLPEFPETSDRRSFLFVGRLSEEKGIEVLVRAGSIANVGEPILVAGAGPMATHLDGASGIQALGQLQSQAIYKQMRHVRALVLPSIWYENFPRTLVEAYACGLPVIASRLGAMASLVEDGVTGLLFEPGSADDLASKLAWAIQNPHAMARMGRNARGVYERDLTSESNYSQLMTIYAGACRSVRQG